MVSIVLLIVASGLGGQGESCVVSADCEHSLRCEKQICVAVVKACKRTAECPGEQHCRGNLCVDDTPAAAAAPPPVAMPPPSTAPGAAHVRFASNSDSSATITALRGDGVSASCALPCELLLRPGGYTILVSGDGVRNARREVFVQGDTQILIHPGSYGAYVAGIVLNVIGWGVFFPGGVALVVGGVTDNGSGGAATIGGTVMIIGAVGIGVAGAVLTAISNTRIHSSLPYGFSLVPLPKGGGEFAFGMNF